MWIWLKYRYLTILNLWLVLDFLHKGAFFFSFWVKDNNKVLDLFMSVLRMQYSTESALLRVSNDLLVSLDSGNHAILILLNLSAAFNTVN